MKKFLLSICAITLATALALCSVGCSNKTYLSFNNNFNGGGDAGEPNASYVETLTYDVTYTDNYRDSLIAKDSDVTDEVVKFRFENGTYTQKLEVLSFMPDTVTTDIDVANNRIYHVNTLFKIDAIYDVNDGNGEKTYNDSIETDAYFLPAGQSFAPIYSYVKTTNTLIALANEMTSVQVQQTTSECIISYNTEKYTVTKIVDEVAEVNEYKYDYRTLIDNSIFFFALRGFTVNEESSADINVVSPSYGEAKTLRITHGGMLSAKITATVEGTAIDETVAVTNLSYQLNTTKNSGSPQYMLIQNAKTDNLPYKAYPIEMAQTLTSYGTFKSLGGLVFSLKTITTTQG